MANASQSLLSPCDAAATDGIAPATRGNPVVLFTGNKIENEIDFVSSGEMGLYLSRTYNHHWVGRGLFGQHWLSNFDYSLAIQKNATETVLWVQYPDGRRLRFIPNGASRWIEDKTAPIATVRLTGG